LGPATGRVFRRGFRRARRAIKKLDSFTRRYRLPLENLLWSALLAGFVLSLGVPGLWAGAALAACLVLTVSGVDGRSLLGLAGVMISAAALAEIVRQRARFLEVFLDLFG
jgi:hypothetical protein